ncbi:MAG: hypothetical protein ACI4DW_03290 [Lachnospiraceae bacterium]
MIRNAVKLLKELIRKIRFRLKLREMDEQWYLTGGNCFGLFPPSFYYTHTEEEIKRITAEEIAKLREIIEQME